MGNWECGLRKPITRGQKTNPFVENRESSIEYPLLNTQRPGTRRQITVFDEKNADFLFPYF